MISLPDFRNPSYQENSYSANLIEQRGCSAEFLSGILRYSRHYMRTALLHKKYISTSQPLKITRRNPVVVLWSNSIAEGTSAEGTSADGQLIT